jgi:RecA-family ATPase
VEDLMAVEINIDWLWQDLLPVSGYGIIAGPTGVGKSQLGLRLCESLVQCSPLLLDWEPKKVDAKVLFFSLEMVLSEIKEFIRTMGETFLPDGGLERFFISPIGNTVPLDRPEGRRLFESVIEEIRPDLIVIDSLSKAMAGDFKADEPVIAFNDYIKRIREKYGVSIIAIHHNRKVQDKRFRSNELDDLYGSRFLSQDASFVLMLNSSKDNQDEIIVNPAKIRFSRRPEMFSLIRNSKLNFTQGITDDNGQDSGPEGRFGLGEQRDFGG